MFGFPKQRLFQHLDGGQLNGRLQKGGCSGMRATPNQDNIAVRSSRAWSPLDSPLLDYFSLDYFIMIIVKTTEIVVSCLAILKKIKTHFDSYLFLLIMKPILCKKENHRNRGIKLIVV